jgi:hypothetical protein
LERARRAGTWGKSPRKLALLASLERREFHVNDSRPP